MRLPNSSNLHYLLLFLALLMIPFMGGTAQEATEILTDTTKKEPVIIPLAEISVRSGETTIKIKKMLESLVGDDEIKKMSDVNDSLILIVDSLLKIERSIDLETRNIRFLNNKESLWERINNSVEQEKSNLSDIVGELDEMKYELEEDRRTWVKTLEALKQDNPGSSVVTHIDDLIFKLDSAKNVIQKNNDQILIILDQTTSKGLLITDLIDKITEITEKKEGQLLASNLPPIWKTDFANAEKWDVPGPLHQFNEMEIKGLIYYLQSHQSKNVIQVILILFFIVFFLLISQRMKKAEINQGSFYQRMLVKILSHPISAALILGIFASLLIYANRPLLFKDLSRIAITIPLIFLVIFITTRKYNKYFYLLGLMINIQLVYYIFPPGHHFYLLSLIFIAVTELVMLTGLYRHFKQHPIKNKSLNRLISVLIVFHIGFSAIGSIGIISGANLLAEVFLNMTLMNMFAGLLLGISTLIINGLIEVGIESPASQRLNIFRHNGRLIERRAVRIVNLSAFVFWVYTSLGVVRLQRSVVEGITNFLTYEVSIGSASFTSGDIMIFFLVIWLSIIIANMIRVILEEDILDNLHLAKGLPHTISVLVRYSLITVGLLLAVSAAGMPLDSLTILFGAFGVGIGFGLQNIFNNLVSGLILLFERPIQIGDTIEVGTLMGNVKSIGIRSSNLRTFDGAEVIVPNGHLIANEVVNWTLSDQTRRIEVLAGVAYGSDPYKVKELFEKVLAEHPDIIKEPAPKVFFNDLGESSLDFRLLFWTSSFGEWIRIRSDIVFKVHDILKAEGIEIPFPQRDLHLRSVDDRITFSKKGEKD